MKINLEWLSNVKSTFRALSARNYRLFFSGQIISLTGTWMQQVAVSWLVYRLTNSPFLFSPFAGVIADRYNRRNMLVSLVAGFGMMVQMASSNIVLQSIVEEDKRGSLLAGGLASKIGAPRTLFLGGFCCVVGALIFALKLPFRRA